jgi:transposase-like protein
VAKRPSNYDEQAKRELVEACLQPGISVAGMALRHGVGRSAAELDRAISGILQLWGRF